MCMKKVFNSKWSRIFYFMSKQTQELFFTYTTRKMRKRKDAHTKHFKITYAINFNTTSNWIKA